MGRKPDPKGKDRPRTIVLSGDVADIAQRLADAGALSATLSDLLRREFGLSGALEEAKAALIALTDQRKAMQADEEALIQRIDALEAETIERKSTIMPALEERRRILRERWAKAAERADRHFDSNERAKAKMQMQNLHDLLAEVENEIQEAMG